MNVLAAMAGITDGDFVKKFTVDNVDMVTLGGYNCDLETFRAGLEISAKTGRQEFLSCPHHLSDDITCEVEKIRQYNSGWNGLVNVNIRACSAGSFRMIKDNDDIDVIEVNAHCRQPQMTGAGAGEYLLQNPGKLALILEEVSGYRQDISVKIRANVTGVDTQDIVEIVDSYNVKYLHVDATNPGVDHADYEILRKICDNSSKHVIANNNVVSRKDYLKMLDCGADSVSVARLMLDGNITEVFE